MTLTKKVQFSNDNTVVYTHSSTDYDRSPFAGASQQLYKFRAELQFIATPPTVYSQQPQQQAKKGTLKINTAVCGGPLFFTGLTTNYSHMWKKLFTKLILIIMEMSKYNKFGLFK